MLSSVLKSERAAEELYHFGASQKDLGRLYCAVSKMDPMFIPSIMQRIYPYLIAVGGETSGHPLSVRFFLSDSSVNCELLVAISSRGEKRELYCLLPAYDRRVSLIDW